MIEAQKITPHQENEINGVIISRLLLDQYGYDSDSITDDELQEVANLMLVHWTESGGFKAALEFAMSE